MYIFEHNKLSDKEGFTATLSALDYDLRLSSDALSEFIDEWTCALNKHIVNTSRVTYVHRSSKSESGLYGYITSSDLREARRGLFDFLKTEVKSGDSFWLLIEQSRRKDMDLKLSFLNNKLEWSSHSKFRREKELLLEFNSLTKVYSQSLKV